MTVDDMDANRQIRAVFARNWVNLQKLDYSTTHGTVYVRVTAGHSLPVGGIESDADAGACISLITSGPACYFTGPMDSNGMVEIAYNL